MKAGHNWHDPGVRNGTGGRTLVQTDRKGIALEGYVPVSQLTDGNPLQGDPNIEATFNCVLYHFVSQAGVAPGDSESILAS